MIQQPYQFSIFTQDSLKVKSNLSLITVKKLTFWQEFNFKIVIELVSFLPNWQILHYNPVHTFGFFLKKNQTFFGSVSRQLPEQFLAAKAKKVIHKTNKALNTTKYKRPAKNHFFRWSPLIFSHKSKAQIKRQKYK